MKKINQLLGVAIFSVALFSGAVLFAHADGIPTVPTVPQPCLVPIGGSAQTCSVAVPALNGSSTPSSTACSALTASNLSSDLQQNVVGAAPNGTVTSYNSVNYATASATQELAQCLGATVMLTSSEAVGSPFTIPPTLEIVYPNGVHENAGYLISTLFNIYSGNVSNWQTGYIDLFENNYHGGSSASGSGSGSTAGTGTNTGTSGNASGGTTTGGGVPVAVVASSPRLAINNAAAGANGTYQIGAPWTLAITSAPMNAAFSLCALHPDGTTDCTPASQLGLTGTTSASGAATLTGIFSASTVGQWVEWASFPATGAISNRISFFVAASVVSNPVPTTCSSVAANQFDSQLDVLKSAVTNLAVGVTTSGLPLETQAVLTAWLQSYEQQLQSIVTQINALCSGAGVAGTGTAGATSSGSATATSGSTAGAPASPRGTAGVPVAPLGTIAIGSTGAQVTLVQQFLISQGLLTITAPTSYFGPLTQAAVIAFQVSKNLPQTGMVDSATLQAMGSVGASQ